MREYIFLNTKTDTPVSLFVLPGTDVSGIVKEYLKAGFVLI